MNYLAFNNTMGSRATRGIIIVDTSSLLNLLVPLTNKFLTPEQQAKNGIETVRLANALKLLAAHGYEVIIPEMVAWEAGGFMRNGKTNGRFFEETAKKLHANDWRELSKDFWLDILRSPDPIYIAPPPAKDTTTSSQFINNLWKCIQPQGLERHEKSELIKKNIMDVQREFCNRADFGDEAARVLLQHMQPPPGVPVFYLVQDRDAKIAVATANPRINVHPLNDSGLYEALKNQHLLSFIGVADSNYKNILVFCRQQLTQLFRSSRHISAQKVIDGNENDGRFSRSLKGLREEIMAGQPSAKPGDEVSEAHTQHAARFKERYGALLGKFNNKSSPPSRA